MFCPEDVVEVALCVRLRPQVGPGGWSNNHVLAGLAGSQISGVSAVIYSAIRQWQLVAADGCRECELGAVHGTVRRICRRLRASRLPSHKYTWNCLCLNECQWFRHHNYYNTLLYMHRVIHPGPSSCIPHYFHVKEENHSFDFHRSSAPDYPRSCFALEPRAHGSVIYHFYA